MSKSDWIEVGMRLLGVYFVVAGASALWRTMLVLAASTARGADASLGSVALLIPFVELIAGAALLFIPWPFDRVVGKSAKQKPLPEHLESMFDDLDRPRDQAPPST